MSNYRQVMLLHDRYELPNGSVEKLEAVLRAAHPTMTYVRPLIPQGLNTREARDWFERFYLWRVEPKALLVGVGRGGLIASAIASAFPALNLSVVAINAPTDEDGLEAEQGVQLALYSSAYEPIKGHCHWDAITAMAYDVKWLRIGLNFSALAYLIAAFNRGADMDKELSMMFPS